MATQRPDVDHQVPEQTTGPGRPRPGLSFARGSLMLGPGLDRRGRRQPAPLIGRRRICVLVVSSLPLPVVHPSAIPGIRAVTTPFGSISER